MIHQQHASLARVVGFWGAVWMDLGSILGAGVFVSLGIVAGIVEPGVVLAVERAALVATANGLSSAQLAAAHPVSGGTYEYRHRYPHLARGTRPDRRWLRSEVVVGRAGWLTVPPARPQFAG